MKGGSDRSNYNLVTFKQTMSKAVLHVLCALTLLVWAKSLRRKSANTCKTRQNCCKNILLNVQWPTTEEVTLLRGELKATITHYHQPHCFGKVALQAGDREGFIFEKRSWKYGFYDSILLRGPSNLDWSDWDNGRSCDTCWQWYLRNWVGQPSDKGFSCPGILRDCGMKTTSGRLQCRRRNVLERETRACWGCCSATANRIKLNKDANYQPWVHTWNEITSQNTKAVGLIKITACLPKLTAMC